MSGWRIKNILRAGWKELPVASCKCRCGIARFRSRSQTFARRIWLSSSREKSRMASLLYQTIEQISRDKHIEPEIIVAAIEEAMVVAARKFYKTDEDLRSKFNPETGQVDLFAVRTVVEEVADPLREIALSEARKQQPA